MHKNFMKIALSEANKAFNVREIPVGAIIVKDNEILSYAFNQKESLNDATAHAEILAIKEASQILKSWRLSDCELYVTLEPCPMCAAAIIESRMKKLVFGAYNFEWGSCGTVTNIFNIFPYGKKIEVIGGIMEKECELLLKTVYSNR